MRTIGDADRTLVGGSVSYDPDEGMQVFITNDFGAKSALEVEDALSLVKRIRSNLITRGKYDPLKNLIPIIDQTLTKDEELMTLQIQAYKLKK